MSEDKLRTTVQRGNDARRLMDDEGFKQVLTDVDESFVQRWRQAETVEERERAHASIGALEEIRKHLRVLDDRGNSAREKLKRENRTSGS